MLKHKLRLDEEADRIISNSIGLNLSRSFGDYNFKNLKKDPTKQGFLAVPEVEEINLRDVIKPVATTSPSKSSKRKRKLNRQQSEVGLAEPSSFCVFVASDGIWNGSFSGQDESEDINSLVASHLMKATAAFATQAKRQKAATKGKKNGAGGQDFSKAISDVFNNVMAQSVNDQFRSTVRSASSCALCSYVPRFVLLFRFSVAAPLCSGPLHCPCTAHLLRRTT